MRTSRPSQRGVSLIEVMVTTVVLAFGLLGVAGLLVKSTTLAFGSHDRTVSTQKIYAFAERMRLNPIGVAAGSYDALSAGASATCPPCANSNACTAAETAATDFCEWSQELAGALAGGQGSVSRSGDLFTITVQWTDPKQSPPTQSYALQVRP